MKSILRILCVCHLVAFGNLASAQVLPAFGSTRSGTTGMQFLKLGPDAKSNSLAGGVTANVSDAASMYWNPAGLTNLDTQKLHIQLGHTSYFANMGLNHAAMAFKPTALRTFGVSIMSLNSAEMPLTTEFMPKGTGQTFMVSNLMLGFSYAQILTDYFRFGVTLKYVNENIAGVVSHNGLFDFGFQYHLDLRDIKFGVSLSNFGFNVKPTGEIVVTTMDAEKQINQFSEIAVPAIFRLGASIKAWEKDVHRVDFHLQLDHPTDNRESLTPSAEYSYKNLMFLRTGYQLGAAGSWPAFGLGFNLQRWFGGLTVDYGFNAQNRLGNVHQVSLSYSFIQ